MMMAVPEVRRRGSAVLPWSDWDPFTELEDMSRRMSELVSGFAGPLASWTPPFDLEETDNEFVVEMDVPGVRKDDVTVELQDNVLHVHGEFKERERTGVLRRQTRRTGEFDYTVTLPGEVAPDNVVASLDNGVLTVRARKAAATKSRRVEITAG